MFEVKGISRHHRLLVGLMIVLICWLPYSLFAQSLDFPTRHAGISFGNSKYFSGIRFNFRDHDVERISGMNFTLWKGYDNERARITGIAAGVIPEGDYLSGVQLGIAGVAADRQLKGIGIGMLGVGSGGSITGIALGGLGVGAGESMQGVFIGGLGVGSGGDITGISIGGLGVGAGINLTGLNIGFLGAGAGENMTGLNFGGLGVGAGKNLTGLNVGGLGAGAGEKVTGINLALLGVGAGEALTGITLAGLGAGAPEVQGFTIAGFAVGGNKITGVSAALGTVRIRGDGEYTGIMASAFNYIEGKQTGISLGIVNYAFQLKGVQIGLINYVRDNPVFLKVLPIINANF